MGNKILIKIHPSPNGKLIAMCDENLFGQIIEDEKTQLNLTSNFYKGEPKNESEILEILKEAYVVNAVGDDSIKILLDNNFISRENIIDINNTPHAQCMIDIQ